MSGQPWAGLTPPYATLVVDPPWPYDDGWPGWELSREQRRTLPYSAMTLAEIKGLEVAKLAKPESYLFLWTTSRYLEAAFEVARAWTFVPRQTLVWCKPPRGEGPGGMFATTTEFIIVAQRIGPRSHARGKRTQGMRIDRTWFEWPRGAHSAKPPAFLDLVEQVSPSPYVELFARQPRLGWDSWGLGYEHLGEVAR
jgi:N6-adenosine-specific RNA methylase IME4